MSLAPPATTGIYFTFAVVILCPATLLAQGFVKKYMARSSFFQPPPVVVPPTNDDPKDTNEPLEKINSADQQPDRDIESGPRQSIDEERHSSMAEIVERLTLKGHVVFEKKILFPSGNLPCNPGKRADRIFREALRKRWDELYQLGLDNGADVYLRSTLAYSVLHECIALDTLTKFTSGIIASYPELIDCRSSHGTTPLMKAIECQHLNIVQLLLERGAEINAQDAMGHTPLMIGAMTNNAWAAKVLIPWGADPDLVDSDGRRAVDLALLYGNARVVSDLHGSAMAVVPGYIAPTVQTNWDGLNLIYTIAMHTSDVVTNVVLAVSLSNSGHPGLSFFTALFMLLPSLFIFCIPYQSVLERVITLLQMRIVYEGLISMGQERLTVRFGATTMFTVVLQNVPSAMLQTYMLAAMIGGNTSLQVNAGSLFAAIVFTVIQSGTCFQNMYLLRFFVKNNDAGSAKIVDKVVTTIGVLLGVILRVTMWGCALLVFPDCCVILFLWVLVTRMRLVNMGLQRGTKDDRSQLEATSADLFASFLTDMPFITSVQCFNASVVLSSVELIIVLGCCVPALNDLPTINALISLFWIWFVFCTYLVVRIHGSQSELPDKEFLLDFFNFLKIVPQAVDMYHDSVGSVAASWMFLRTEFKIWLEKRREPASQQEVIVSADASIKGDPALTTPLAGQEFVYGEAKKAPVAPPMLQENLLTFDFSKLKYETLLTREKICFGIVFVIVLCGIMSLLAAMGSCQVVSVDDYSGGHNDDVECARGFDPQLGNFGIKVSPYFILVFAMIYLVECAMCPVAQSLRNLWPEERGYDAYLRARTSVPTFYWHSESYHIVVHTETTRHADGTTTTRTWEEKVVTHTASMYYDFDYWLDDSDEYPKEIDLCRVSSSNEFCFDDFTRADYDTKYARFKTENDRDVHQICSSTYKLNDSTRQAMPAVLIYSVKAPYFLRYTYYLCAVLLLLAPWYRWYVTNISQGRHVRILKQVRKYAPQADRALILRWGAAPE